MAPRIPGRPVPQHRNQLYTRQSPASPVHLSSSLVLVSGGNGSVSPAALKNPMGQDMEVLEIKFELSGDAMAGQQAVFGGTIMCELVMGNHKITNGSIPVWNFGRAENLEGESKGAGANSFQSYSWRLPRPLYVPAGAVVAPKFTHTGFTTQPINVRVGYSARTTFVKPKRIYLPWVAKYISKAFNPLQNADVDNSTELDLVNPHAEPLHLQRFVGRTLKIRSDGVANEDDPQSFGSQYLTMRMTDSYGRPIVRSYTPFRSVFGAITRSWDLDNGAVLDPESYYLVNLKKAESDLGSDADAAAQAFISMVGWRELGAL